MKVKWVSRVGLLSMILFGLFILIVPHSSQAYYGQYGGLTSLLGGSSFGTTSVSSGLYGGLLGSMYGGLYGSMYGGLYGSMYGGLYGSSLYGGLYGSSGLYGGLYGGMMGGGGLSSLYLLALLGQQGTHLLGKPLILNLHHIS